MHRNFRNYFSTMLGLWILHTVLFRVHQFSITTVCSLKERLHATSLMQLPHLKLIVITETSMFSAPIIYGDLHALNRGHLNHNSFLRHGKVFDCLIHHSCQMLIVDYEMFSIMMFISRCPNSHGTNVILNIKQGVTHA